MAKAYKCDRCGELYEKYDGVKFDIQGNKYTKVSLVNEAYCRTFDMCQNCMTKLMIFMKTPYDEEELF